MSYDIPVWLVVTVFVYSIGFYLVYSKVSENDQTLRLQRRELERKIREEGGRELEPESKYTASDYLVAGFLIGWVFLLYIMYQVRIPPTGPF